MARHDPVPVPGAAAPLSEAIRRRIAQLPERLHAAAGRPGPPPATLDVFSAARIYTTFRVTLAEHFPEDLGEQGFDLLVDIMIYEWLGGRLGAQPDQPFGIGRHAAASPRIRAVREAGLITLEADAERDDILIVRLTARARARLHHFFDYMARYVSAM